MNKTPIFANQETLILPSERCIELSNSKLDFNFEYIDKFSISFWIKTKSQQVSAVVAKMPHKVPFTGWDILLNDVGLSGVLRFQLIHSFPENWIEVRADVSDIIDGNWHHVIIVYGGLNKVKEIKFFVNGLERNLHVVSDCLSKSTINLFPVTIGSRSNGEVQFYGCISDMRIYDNTLNTSEVEEIFSSSRLYQKKIQLKEQNSNALVLKDVKKIYQLHHNSPRTIFEKISTLLEKKDVEDLLVLDKVNIEIKHGEMVGIIGRNGSGKTTLLKLMAGIVQPTEGKIYVNGRIAPFLALGSGFNPELDAKENILLYGMLLGISKKEIISKMDQILKFAELEHYADVKLKKFSSGMFMRLAFSVAAALDPDILLIDEVLAVGDESFQKKSFQKLLSFKEDGKSIILITHNLEQVENLCDRAIFLQSGKITAIGNPKEVIDMYKKTLADG